LRILTARSALHLRTNGTKHFIESITMSYSYDEEDEIDIHLRRGRASPAFERPRARPVYYESRSGGRLEIAGGSYGRSRSRGPRPVSPAPVIINNRIYNDYEEEDDRQYLQLAAPVRTRSRSRPRSPGYMSREDYELERTRKELESYKIQAQREEDEKLLKKELELKRLREEKRAEDEKKRAKEEAEKAVKEWKIKEAEKKEKEKKEKEEREKEYKKRLEEDLRNSHLDERQIAAILKKDKEVDPNRPTYTRMARRYLSIETLNAFRIDYTLDPDPEYVLIKRWVPEYEQDFLWNHTKEIRERRHSGGTVVLAIEEKKHHHHDAEYEFVRKKEHKRKPSPSPLVTFLAGGRGR